MTKTETNNPCFARLTGDHKLATTCKVRENQWKTKPKHTLRNGILWRISFFFDEVGEEGPTF